SVGATDMEILSHQSLANKGTRCLTGQYTTSGECCRQCQPGEGVIKECGVTQTVCAPCIDKNFSHTEKCQKCTQCTGLLRMETPCTDANDAICTCNYGYYLNSLSQRCELCTKCPEGQGMLISCENDHDTVCEECNQDTYSDQESFREPCMPCTTCDESEVVQECSPISDTVCLGKSFNDGGFFVDPPLPLPTEITTSTTGGDSRQPIYQGLNDKLIPVYCSVLAAGVGGVVAFIIFKRWNSCKQNKQGANNCTANPNQTPSPEGEKLHSDSGISVDSQSLQEGQTQTHTGITLEKVEQLLFRGSDTDNCNMDDSDWSNLAGLLGYEEERIATFRLEDHPVRALLSDWASKDSASIDALCTALRKINREDIAQSLVLGPNATKPTATSVV
uniref:Nerve growth factor receptor b n=1 Tax=Neogobius melanostomus TaxID=47308 RepID=A0A8C6S9F5_9GOBI